LKLTNEVIASMEQSPSWEADSHSASREFPRGSLPCSQDHTTGRYRESYESSPNLPILFP